MRRPLILLISAAGLVIPTLARGTCAQRGATAFGNATGVSLITSNFANSIATQVGNAAGMWNGAGCGDSGGSGFDWPLLSTIPNQYSHTISIVYAQGNAPSRACTINNQPAYCSAERSGTTVTVYQYYGVNAELTTRGFEANPTTADAAAFSNLLAHEIGHTLGLANDSCPGGIMNSNVPTNPTVTSDECTMLDQVNVVQNETADCQVQKNCQCAPDDLNCQGSPIVINLGDRGYEMTGLDNPVRFDLNDNGRPELTSWTAAGSPMAFLWLDRNSNGAVDSGAELFGNYTPVGMGVAANGFEALASMDDNRDDQIDAHDLVWRSLRLWIDWNHNGRSDHGEISEISQSDIVAISLAYVRDGRRDQFGNTFRFRSVVTLRRPHGVLVTRPVYDVYFTRVNN